ncbi:hypothetical protein CPAV1605_1466 [seawater metagenome]|uniref:Uncharacterized protein n=1 Tax=seawater metagenome TaxID=1561972 RepID=A0A5E8CKF5_9ZZZZ
MVKILTFPEFYEILMKHHKSKLNYDVCKIIYKFYLPPKPKFHVGELVILKIVHHESIFKIKKIVEYCKYRGYIYQLECDFGSIVYEYDLIKLSQKEKNEYNNFFKSFSNWLLEDDDLLY